MTDAPGLACLISNLAKGTVPDHGEEWTSSGHRDYDYLEWIARLTSHLIGTALDFESR